MDKLREVRAFDIPAVIVGYGRKEIPGFINVVTDSPKIGRIGRRLVICCTARFKHFAYCSYRRISPGLSSGGNFLSNNSKPPDLQSR